MSEEHQDINAIKALKNEIEILEELNKGEKCEYIPLLYDTGNLNYQTESNIKENKKRNINMPNQDDENPNKVKPYYVTNYYSRGILFFYLTKFKELREINKKLLFKKIILAVQFCHNRNICHLNLKPSKIIFDANFEPKIIGFKLSRKFTNSETLFGKVGTAQYRCPEIWENSKYIGSKADIFSLGVILFNLVTGMHGFLTSKKDDIYYRYIASDDFKSYWESISKDINISELSQEFKDLYIQMVSYNPSKRPELDDILHSDWMKEINDLNENEIKNELKELKYKLKDSYQKLIIINEELKIAEELTMEYMKM